MVDLTSLPGAELVEQGLADLAAGRESIPALLVAVAGARLERLGIRVGTRIPDAELRLYEKLGEVDPAGAYARYNALLRTIASFASAMEREQGQALREARKRAAGAHPK